MVQREKTQKAILAIHNLIIRARMLVFDFSKEQMFELLDEIEYLPALILIEENETILFENYLKNVCEKYKFTDILRRYYASNG